MNFKNKFAACIAALLLSVSASSNADINPWTQCGIGAMIFSDSHTAAAISNIIFDLGTTAVSSANLSKENCAGKDVVAARFINETYDNLAEETAIGDGKHLHAMLEILGCESSSHAAIIGDARMNFSSYMNKMNIEKAQKVQKAEAYYNIIQNTIAHGYAQQCQV